MKEDAPIIKLATIWRRKENTNQENFQIEHIIEDKEEEDEWYIDSGFSTYMTGDQNKFISLNKKGDVRTTQCTFLPILFSTIILLITHI